MKNHGENCKCSCKHCYDHKTNDRKNKEQQDILDSFQPLPEDDGEVTLYESSLGYIPFKVRQ